MKKQLLLGLMLGAMTLADAQLVEVESVQKVPLGPLSVYTAEISPDGLHAVVADQSGSGLAWLTLSDGTARAITDNGSTTMLQFTADGSAAVYRASTFDASHRRYVALYAYDTATGDSRRILSPTRTLEAFGVSGNSAVAVDGGRAVDIALTSPATAAARPVAGIAGGLLQITADGNTRTFSPLGERANSYLWPSVSPDGTRVAFFAVGCGAFTCRLDGSDLRSLGMLRAVRWLDDNTLVGMDDHDNGFVTTESVIVAVSADGSVSQRITGPDTIAVFPSTAPGKVAFTTPAGEMYVITLKQ